MKENLALCSKLGSRPECESCTNREIRLPVGWSEDFTVPCITELQQSVAERTLVVRAEIEAMQSEQSQLIDEGLQRRDFSRPFLMS